MRGELTSSLDDEGERHGDVTMTLKLPTSTDAQLHGDPTRCPLITVTPGSEVVFEDRSPGWVESVRVVEGENVVTVKSKDDVTLRLESDTSEGT